MDGLLAYILSKRYTDKKTDEHTLEHVANKANEINDSNKTSTELYPSIKAVYDLFTSIVNGNEVSY